MFSWLWPHATPTVENDDIDDDECWLPDDERIPGEVRASYGDYRDDVGCVVFRACKDADEFWLFSDDGDLIDILSRRL